MLKKLYWPVMIISVILLVGAGVYGLGLIWYNTSHKITAEFWLAHICTIMTMIALGIFGLFVANEELR